MTDCKRQVKRKRQIDPSAPKEGSAEEETKMGSPPKQRVTPYCNNLSAQINSEQGDSQHRTIHSCLETCSLAAMMSLNWSKDLPLLNRIWEFLIQTKTVLGTLLIQQISTRCSSHTDRNNNNKKITTNLVCC